MASTSHINRCWGALAAHPMSLPSDARGTIRHWRRTSQSDIVERSQCALLQHENSN
jgi:hypothetical protein